jgi:predicted DNA-binding protein (MmcQ/YjbR family)
MRLSLGTMATIVMCFVAGPCFGQTVQEMSLCRLQEKVAPGEHMHVRISGVYSVGPENSTLDDPTCPVTPYQSTWVEFDLKSKRNDKKLRKLLEHSQRVYLTSEGEFYGPPLPDPKLPEALQKGFPPHWGHLGCCRTRLVVHVIRDVKTTPTDQTNGSSSVGLLCSLQQNVAEGNHKTVRVSGVFSEELERGALEDAACPNETTWVELALRSEQKKEKLRKLLERSRRAYVVGDWWLWYTTQLT